MSNTWEESVVTIYRKGEQCRGYLASFSTYTGFASCFIFTMTEKLKSEVGISSKTKLRRIITLAVNANVTGRLSTAVKKIVYRKRRESIKRNQKLKYSEPHRFKKKANEDQHKFNRKVIDSLAEVSKALERSEITQAQEALQKGKLLLNERQKHILLADKPEFGWATVNEYKKHELADNSEDEKRIIKSELRAKAQRKQIRSNISSRRFGQKSEKEELRTTVFTY